MQKVIFICGSKYIILLKCYMCSQNIKRKIYKSNFVILAEVNGLEKMLEIETGIVIVNYYETCKIIIMCTTVYSTVCNMDGLMPILH